MIGRRFYRDAAKGIHIKYYQDVLDADLSFVCKLMLPVTTARVKEMRQKYLEKYFRFYVEQKLQQFLKSMVVSALMISVEG